MEDKNVQIARQSSLKVAQEFLCCKQVNFTLEELIQTSDLITTWVTNGKTDDVKSRIKKFDDYFQKKQK